MSIWQRIKAPFTSEEKRASDASWSAIGNPLSNPAVNSRTAENLSTVMACVTAISGSIASLPAVVFVNDNSGRKEVRQHPLSNLIRRGPNEWQTWPDFMEWLVAQVLLRGNALVVLEHDAAGKLTGLKPIPWEWVSVQLMPSGRLAYDVVEQIGLYGSKGRPRRLLDTEVIHLRDRSDDGLVGKSRLQRATEVILSGLAVQEFAGAMYRNGANPSGAVEVEGTLGFEARQRLREEFTKVHTGSSNAAKVLLLDQGLKWKQISVSPEDAELLASRRFTTEELARVFGCPPPIIGDLSHGTFTNTVEVGKWFAQHTLTPWIRKIEAEFTRSVFTEAEKDMFELELDLSGFMRGDHAARWQGYAIAVQNDILDPEEIRAVEGWDPRAPKEASI